MRAAVDVCRTHSAPSSGFSFRIFYFISAAPFGNFGRWKIRLRRHMGPDQFSTFHSIRFPLRRKKKRVSSIEIEDGGKGGKRGTIAKLANTLWVV